MIWCQKNLHLPERRLEGINQPSFDGAAYEGDGRCIETGHDLLGNHYEGRQFTPDGFLDNDYADALAATPALTTTMSDGTKTSSEVGMIENDVPRGLSANETTKDDAYEDQFAELDAWLNSGAVEIGYD